MTSACARLGWRVKKVISSDLQIYKVPHLSLLETIVMARLGVIYDIRYNIKFCAIQVILISHTQCPISLKLFHTWTSTYPPTPDSRRVKDYQENLNSVLSQISISFPSLPIVMAGDFKYRISDVNQYDFEAFYSTNTFYPERSSIVCTLHFSKTENFRIFHFLSHQNETS